MRQSLQTLKGVGEKTEKLFFRLGIYDTEDLLHYYPRNYDAFEAPVDIADLEEGTVKAVSAAVCSGDIRPVPRGLPVPVQHRQHERHPSALDADRGGTAGELCTV